MGTLTETEASNLEVEVYFRQAEKSGLYGGPYLEYQAFRSALEPFTESFVGRQLQFQQVYNK